MLRQHRTHCKQRNRYCYRNCEKLAMHACNPSTQEEGEDQEFKTILSYIGSSRAAWAIKNTLLKNSKNNNNRALRNEKKERWLLMSRKKKAEWLNSNLCTWQAMALLDTSLMVGWRFLLPFCVFTKENMRLRGLNPHGDGTGIDTDHISAGLMGLYNWRMVTISFKI